MARDRQRDALQTIFSFFVGLMVLAFIGVGVNTFYQSPEQDASPLRDAEAVSPADQAVTGNEGRPLHASRAGAKYDAIQDQIDALQKEHPGRPWRSGRATRASCS